MATVIPDDRAHAVPELSARTAAEFDALTAGCAIYDLGSRTKLSLTGSDRVRWLNGMITNNVRDLAVNTGIYGFLLNPQGHIQADLYAYNLGESLLVDVDRRLLDKVTAHFEHYIIMDDVEVRHLDDLGALGVAGPLSRGVLSSVGLSLPQTSLQFIQQTWQEKNITVVRSDNESVESYEIWLAMADLPVMQNQLSKAGAIPVNEEALELFRIACGIPCYGQDIRERDLPQETEQQRALHFSKGCYIGQEIVERIRSRGAVHRKFTGFESLGAAAIPGAKIQSEGKDVGEITSAASLPVPGGPLSVALGYIRREIAASGKQVQAGDTPLVVTQLPFEKALNPRGKNA